MSSNTASSKSTTSPSLQAAILRFKLSLNKDISSSSSTHSHPTDDSQFDLNFSNRGNKLHFNSDNVDYTKLNSYRDDLKLSKINQYDQFNSGDNLKQRLIITSKNTSIDDIIRRQIDSEFGNDYKHTKKLKSAGDSDDDDDDLDEDDEYTDSIRDLLNSVDVAGILGPILKPTDIVKRKSIEDIYTSSHLSKLSEEIIHLVEKEQNSVNQLSKLMNVFLGDNPNDLLADSLLLPKYDHSLDIDELIKKEDVTKGDVVQEPASITNDHPVDNGDEQPKSKKRKTSTPQPKDVDTTQEEEEEDHDVNSKANNKDNKDNAASSSPSSSSSSTTTKITNETINKSIKDPFFQLPEYKKDFNFGVSKIEHAEESRQLIQIALQRNEEFIRSLTNIRNGFIRADRLKNNIYKWCREMHEDEEMESQNRVVSNSISSTPAINNTSSTNGDGNNNNNGNS